MSLKLTKRKWFACGNGFDNYIDITTINGGKLIDSPDESLICEIDPDNFDTPETALEIARLIAAAPKLLAALQDAVKNCSCCDGKGNAYTMADAMIAEREK